MWLTHTLKNKIWFNQNLTLSHLKMTLNTFAIYTILDYNNYSMPFENNCDWILENQPNWHNRPISFY